MKNKKAVKVLSFVSVITAVGGLVLLYRGVTGRGVTGPTEESVYEKRSKNEKIGFALFVVGLVGSAITVPKILKTE